MSACGEILINLGDEKAFFCGKKKEREVIATKAQETVSRFLQPVPRPVLTIVRRPLDPGEYQDLCDAQAAIAFGWGG
jgi:hypothetical protein